MSVQDDLDQRAAELEELLGWMEALLPSLMVHGLHITAKDMTLFNKQYNEISSKVGDLPEEDQSIGLKILHWFHHNYPHPEQRRLPSARRGRHLYRPAAPHRPNIFEMIIRREHERERRRREHMIHQIFFGRH